MICSPVAGNGCSSSRSRLRAEDLEAGIKRASCGHAIRLGDQEWRVGVQQAKYEEGERLPLVFEPDLSVCIARQPGSPLEDARCTPIVRRASEQMPGFLPDAVQPSGYNQDQALCLAVIPGYCFQVRTQQTQLNVC